MKWYVAQNRTPHTILCAGENICVFPSLGPTSQPANHCCIDISDITCVWSGCLIHTKCREFFSGVLFYSTIPANPEMNVLLQNTPREGDF